MAKRRKSPEAKAVAQLESDREWLIRTTLLGKGYIVKALEVAKDSGDQTAMTLHARHLAEMDLAINGCRPAAEDVLRRLGDRVAKAEKAIAAGREIKIQVRGIDMVGVEGLDEFRATFKEYDA